jgi:outer membrane protein insertion porin family
MTKKAFLTILLTVFLLFQNSIMAQVVRTGDQINIDFNNPQEYRIGGISVSGVNFIDQNVIIMVSQLTVGDRILVPGEDIARAIENIWKQGLFTDVKISVNIYPGQQYFP